MLGDRRHTRLYATAAPLLCVLAATSTGEVTPPPGDGVHPAGSWFGSPLTRPVAEGRDRGATPRAIGDCGPGGRPETGLQGEVPIADQASGRSKQGYQCNLRRIGHDDIGRRGQNFQLAWYGDCAYVSTIGLRDDTGRLEEPDPALDGIAVVDAAHPRAPRMVGVVASPKGKSQHEALEVNQARGLLVATQGGLNAQWLEVYDVKADCRHPRFLGRYDAGRPIMHGLRVSDDGRTAYATDVYDIGGAGQVLHAIDITDPTEPKRLGTWAPELSESPDQHGVHDLETNEDGTRLYLGTTPVQAAGGVLVAGPPTVGPGTSMAILDSSELQARKPRARMKVVSRLSLPNIGHTVQRIRIGGKPYLLVSGEAPFGGPHNCPWAWGHIVDISDERRPKRVSDIRLQVNELDNCTQASRDEGAIYSIHYVGVDDERDTSLVFYTYYTGGLRVFDVRDPANPKEIAYYQPPSTPGTRFPALSPVTPDSGSEVFDHTTSVVRYRPETGEVWVVSVNAGFQVLQLTGQPARQQANLKLGRRRGRMIPARITCAQPCRAIVGARAGRRRGPVRSVELPRSGAATVRLRLPARTSRRARVAAAAQIADRLTGERQLRLTAR